MKRVVLAAALGLIPILAVSTFAQDRSNRGGGETGRSISPGAGGMVPSGPSSGTTRGSDSTRSQSSNPAMSAGAAMGGFAATPNLQGTSFVSYNSYVQAQEFFYYLHTRYMMNDWYFTRFYRNTEPLITPQLLRMTMKEPVDLSTQMVKAMDDLRALVNEAQAGHTVNKVEVSSKAEEIRALARRIRHDNSIAYFDQRQGKDILRGTSYSQMGLGVVSQLNDLVTELHTQIKSLYGQTTTSTVSVQTLTKPSFESLSKAIERLSKVIENSAQRL